MKDKLKNLTIEESVDYGLHPVTGKKMSYEDFDILAKEQNWTYEERLNNIGNATTKGH